MDEPAPSDAIATPPTDAEAAATNGAVEAEPVRSGSAALLRLSIALALALTALSAWLVVALGEASELRAAAEDRAAVQEVAGRFAAAVYSYDHRDLPASKRRVLDLSTVAFRREYEEGFGAIEAVLTEAKAISEATVSDVFTASVEGSEATCIVLVDTVVSGVAGRRSGTSYSRVSLVKVEGHWRVNDLVALDGGSASSPVRPPEDPSTTTTRPSE